MDEFLLQASRAALAIVGAGGSLAIVLAALRRPQGRRAWLTVVPACAILLMFGAAILPSWGLSADTQQVAGVLWFIGFPLLAATFPDGRFRPRWSVWLVAGYAAILVVDTILGGALRAQDGWVVVPWTQTAMLILPIDRYRRTATTEDRESMRWVILGSLLTVALFQLIQFVDGVIGNATPLAEAKANGAGLPIAIALVIGLARPRLWNVDAAFRAFLAVAVSAIGLGVVYWFGSAGSAALGESAARAGWWGAAAVGIAAYPVIRLGLFVGTAIVYRGRPDAAAAASGLATALDAGTGPRSVGETIVAVVAEAVGSVRVSLVAANAGDAELFDAAAPAGAGLGAGLPAGAGSGTGLPAGAGAGLGAGPRLWTRSRRGAARDEGAPVTLDAGAPAEADERVPAGRVEGGPAGVSAAAGTRAGAAEEFAIDFRGERLAVLRVAPRRGESALTAYDRAAVRGILSHAGPALHGARALVEATDAQARLVTAREEERRRLRSDLHDDLAPTLSGLSLSAAALSRRARASDPELAADADELHLDIQSAVEQTREISHGLRPSVLDDHGLAAAVRERVVDPLRGELDLTLEAEGLGVLPAAVDLAALRIVQEAVANVRRHARASGCRIRIDLVAGGLRVEVTDDGVGLPAAVRPGVGLRSIRSRAEELGGTAEFGRTSRGGTRVRVLLPVAEPEEVAS